MSDPVTNVEIEDVLSSIRKLVSDEARAPRSASAERAERELDRFVLTPALRVEEDETAPLAPSASEPDDSTDQSPLPDPSADTANEGDWRRDLSERSKASQTADVTKDEIAFRRDLPTFLLQDRVAAKQAETASTGPEQSHGGKSRTELESKIAALEAAIGKSQDEFEPDGSEMPASPGWDGAGWEDSGAVTFSHHRFDAPEDTAEPTVRRRDRTAPQDDRPGIERPLSQRPTTSPPAAAADTGSDDDDAPPAETINQAPVDEDGAVEFSSLAGARLADLAAAVGPPADTEEDVSVALGKRDSAPADDEAVDLEEVVRLGVADDSVAAENEEDSAADAAETATETDAGPESERQIDATPGGDEGGQSDAAAPLEDELQTDADARGDADPQADTDAQPDDSASTHSDPQKDLREEENAEAVAAALSDEPNAKINELEDLLAEGAAMDEAVLRALVAAIVREELQGTLGERITRNVRKLVRREIHRVLAAHELE